MTNEQFMKEHYNPWMEVADMYKPENSDCLFGDNNKEQEEKQEDNKEDKKDEKPAETEKKEVMDVLMDEEGKEQKEGANKYPDEIE